MALKKLAETRGYIAIIEFEDNNDTYTQKQSGSTMVDEMEKSIRFV